ncbi:MAG: hypothetical protein ACOYM9_26410, partial [Bradymonadia bacterium]
VLAHLRRMREAYARVQDATRLGPPAERAAEVEGTRTTIETALLAEGALVRLDVTPPDARLQLDGADVEGGRVYFVSSADHHVRATREGYEDAARVLRCAKGSRCDERITLEPVRTTGSLHVSGAPQGAEVLVDDQLVGTLPSARVGALTAGKHTLTVRAVDHLTATVEIDVAAGQAGVHEIVLTPLTVATPVSARTIGGWTSVGTGAVLMAIGAGLLGHAVSFREDASDLDRAAQPDYDAQYDALSEEYRSFAVAGWSLTGVGLGAIAAGISTLLWPTPTP